MKNKRVEPELSRPLIIDKIPPAGIEETIVASAAEREKLAKRFGLLDLSTLTAKLNVGQTSKISGVPVSGTLTADVVQQCIVTLEPVPAHIEQHIDVQYANLPADDDADVTTLLTSDQDDVEPIVNGVIDLGEMVAQYLGASLDPYPRKPGVAFINAQFGEEDRAEAANPFAKLVNLPKKPKD